MQVGEADLLAVRNLKAPIHSSRLRQCGGGRLGRPARAKLSGLGARRPAPPRIYRLIVAVIRCPPPTAPHPSASRCKDKSALADASFPKPPDNALAVRSACKARKALRSPAPRTTKSPATANPLSSLLQTQDGTAADRVAAATVWKPWPPSLRRKELKSASLSPTSTIQPPHSKFTTTPRARV